MERSVVGDTGRKIGATGKTPGGSPAARAVTALPGGLGSARRVVVFGGSFDPVHRWHTAVAG